MNDELSELKRDGAALMRAYADAGGREVRDKGHAYCPLCQKDDGFSFYLKDELPHWKCHHCGLQGTIVDLVKGAHGIDDKLAARLALAKYGKGSTGVRRPRPVAPGELPNKERNPFMPTGKGRLWPDVDQAIDAQALMIARDPQNRNVHSGARQYDGRGRPSEGAAEYFPYTDQKGMPQFIIARFDFERCAGFYQDGKVIELSSVKNGAEHMLRHKLPGIWRRDKQCRPIRRDGNGWRAGLGEWGRIRKCALFGLKEITTGLKEPRPGAPALYVAEGERKALAMRALGLLATTSQGGSGRAAETDWTPAARFARVVIWEDADWTNSQEHPKHAKACAPGLAGRCPECSETPGEKYGRTVAELITAAAAESKIQNPESKIPEIVLVELHAFGLGDGGDVHDLIKRLRGEGKDDAEIVASLAAVAQKYGKAAGGAPALSTDLLGEVVLPDQPMPVGAAPVGRAGRVGRELRNWEWHGKQVPDGKGGEKTELQPWRIPIDDLRHRLQELTRQSLGEKKGERSETTKAVSLGGGFPCRVLQPGAKTPLLFVDEELIVEAGGKAGKPAAESGEVEVSAKVGTLLKGQCISGRVLWLGNCARFKSWTHNIAAPSFRDKLDGELFNYVGFEDLYQSFGSARDVGEYAAVEVRPHFPPIPGHYYAWTWGLELQDRNPAGFWLKKLLSFFSNCQDDVAVAVLAAAVLTPAWGGNGDGAYGKRPMIVLTAPDRGCGKSSVVEVISKLYSGYLSINLQGRDEDELLQRLLTPDALTRRITYADNVKGTLSSALLEHLITTETISGKRLYSGEATRPNALTCFCTGNDMRLSRDMALRSYIIELVKPKYDPHWDLELAEFLKQNWRLVLWDCGRVLCAPAPVVLKEYDRWAQWQRDVLERACALMKIDIQAVMARQSKLREECDDDLEEARLLSEEVLTHLCMRNTREPWLFTDADTGRLQAVVEARWPTEPAWLSSKELLDLRMFKGTRLKPKQIYGLVKSHVVAGRMVGFSALAHSRGGNGYWVTHEEIRRFLAGVGKVSQTQPLELVGEKT